MLYINLCLFDLIPDINECANSSAVCDSNASCSNIEGSFECTCNEGYTGNGSSCEGNCNITIEALIIPLLLWDDYVQVDIDECTSNSHICEQNCTNTAGSYVCFCQNGYTLDQNGLSCSGK